MWVDEWKKKTKDWGLGVVKDWGENEEPAKETEKKWLVKEKKKKKPKRLWNPESHVKKVCQGEYSDQLCQELQVDWDENIELAIGWFINVDITSTLYFDRSNFRR